MKTIPRFMLAIIPLFAVLAGGCAARSISFKGNRVIALPNGQSIIKGFGDIKGKSVVCSLDPGPYGSARSQKTEAGVDVVKYVSAKVSHEAASQTVLMGAQTERLQALEKVLSQMCFAYGNGAFGSVGDTTTMDRYFKEIHALLQIYSAPAPAPASSPAPPP